MSERTRGIKWALRQREAGHLVLKLPASSLAGIADWLVVRPSGTWFVEAKVLRDGGRWAFSPSDCTRAQRHFLESVVAHGGKASILVLGPSRFLEVAISGAVAPITQREFQAAAETYKGE